MSEATSEKIKAFFGLFVISAIVIAIGWGASAASNSKAEGPTDAISICEGFVKDKLISPATANFTGEIAADDPTNTDTGPGYTVTGNVDSDNGFGALIRSTWTCTVHTNGTTWHGTTTIS